MGQRRRKGGDSSPSIAAAFATTTAQSRRELARLMELGEPIEPTTLRQHVLAVGQAIRDISDFLPTSRPPSVDQYEQYLLQELNDIWNVYTWAYQDYKALFYSDRGFLPKLRKHTRRRWEEALSGVSGALGRTEATLRAASHEFSRKGSTQSSALYRVALARNLSSLSKAWFKLGAAVAAVKD